MCKGLGKICPQLSMMIENIDAESIIRTRNRYDNQSRKPKKAPPTLTNVVEGIIKVHKKCAKK